MFPWTHWAYSGASLDVATRMLSTCSSTAKGQWLELALRQIENIRCFNSTVVSLLNTAPRPNWPSATRSNVCTCEQEPSASPQRSGSKATNPAWACARDTAGLPTATSLWPDGRRTGSGAAKWRPVRDTLVQCWPNNAPGLAGPTRHDCCVCRQSGNRTLWAVLCGLAWLFTGQSVR